MVVLAINVSGDGVVGCEQPTLRRQPSRAERWDSRSAQSYDYRPTYGRRPFRHCEAWAAKRTKSDEAIQPSVPPAARLLLAPPSNMLIDKPCGTEDWIASLRSQ